MGWCAPASLPFVRVLCPAKGQMEHLRFVIAAVVCAALGLRAAYRGCIQTHGCVCATQGSFPDQDTPAIRSARRDSPRPDSEMMPTTTTRQGCHHVA